MRINQQIIILKQYKAVEFSNKVLCITVNMKKRNEIFNELKINYTTQLSKKNRSKWNRI